jgi:hypothetical protein
MKFKLSRDLLRKLLIGTTVFNIILLITYVFLLISASFLENYFIFILSIPAFVFSKSWLLITGLFGVEICLLIYYWYKNKKTAPVETSNNEEIIQSIFDEELIETDLIESIKTEPETIIEPTVVQESVIVTSDELENEEDNILDIFEEDLQEKTPVLTKAEQEFELLWKEAIEHVKLASTKKKTGGSDNLKKSEIPAETAEFHEQSKVKAKSSSKDISPLQFDIEAPSRAVIPKSKIKPKRNNNNYSLIKDEHREFYNELAINNWIYKNSSDRERIGLYKLALDETRFREKNIQYLLEAGIIYKLVLPFHNGAFVVYAISENEDKKIIGNYLAKFCKQNNLTYNQKSIAFVNYSELGLDQKNWRFDFYINNSIVGVIWISNFLIEDNQSPHHTLAYKNKKTLQALLATSQINFTNKFLTPLIITDYGYNAREIKRYLDKEGYGQAEILAIGEKKFEQRFLKISRKAVSV